MTSHKHAEVLRQIADGVSIDEFEAHNIYHKDFLPLRECFATDAIPNCPADGWITSPDKWEIRRKPKYIMVNGFKVPKPLDVMPTNGDVYVPATSSLTFYDVGYAKYEWTREMLSRGALHATKEAAIAHAKAMLGLDPKWET